VKQDIRENLWNREFVTKGKETRERETVRGIGG